MKYVYGAAVFTNFMHYPAPEVTRAERNRTLEVMKCGYIIRGEMAGKWWEIIRQEAGALYRLEIGGEFYASADCIRNLLDEVTAFDKLARG